MRLAPAGRGWCLAFRGWHDPGFAGLHRGSSRRSRLGSSGRATLGFGFADLEACDGLGRGAGDFGEHLVAVVDAERVVGGLDGDGAAGVGDSDVDALSGDDKSTAAADPPLDLQGFWCGDGWWAGGSGITDAGDVAGGERVGQATQQHTGGGDLQDAAVDPDGDAPASELVADWVLPAGQGDQAVGINQPVDLDRPTRLDGAGLDGWRAGRATVVGQQLVQLTDGQPGRNRRGPGDTTRLVLNASP